MNKDNIKREQAMNSNSNKLLADKIVSGLRENLPKLLEPIGNLWSVAVMGSYPRGDFVENNSDLDINIIFKKKEFDIPHYLLREEQGCKVIKDYIDSILGDRVIYSHAWFANNECKGIELMTFLLNDFPEKPEDIKPPHEGPEFPYFNIFMFDYVENLMVLWGNDPRNIMPDPPDPKTMAVESLRVNLAKCKRAIDAGMEFRVPFNAFKAIQVAQLFFGERSLDKRRLLELYNKYVPDFPMKDFGCKIITDKMEQRFPDNPPHFAPISEYMNFVGQLSVLAEKTSCKDG